MATYTMGDVSDSISDIQGYIFYGEAIPGSNGDTGGTPTYDLGTDPSHNNYGYNIWDQSAYDGDMSDGFDTGTSAFSLDCRPGSGSNSLNVAGAGAISYTSPGSQSIGSLRVRAGAQISGVVNWTGLTIHFYQGGTLKDSLSLAQGPAVDTTPSTSSGVAEQVLIVAPRVSSTAYDRVTVGGSVRMQTPPGTIPGPTDLFCQVFIMP